MNDPKYKNIFTYNREWAARMKAQDPNYFQELSKDQNPDFLFIGCCDSRVPADTITGLEMGDLFVHRNIANLVVHTDVNLLSVLQYSVEVLKVKHIIVCGHYKCGGVRAAMDNKEMGIIDNWLRNIRDVYRIHKEELDGIVQDEERWNALVEKNVEEQCLNLMKIGLVQKNYRAHGFPSIHGLVYDLPNGLLKDLNIDFKDSLKSLMEVYKLY